MSTFDKAIPVILAHEGGLVDNPADPGGITQFGISKRWADSQGLDIDIKELTLDKAKELYKKYFWNPIYEQLLDQTVSTKIFDLTVNMGAKQAHKLAQRACQGTCTVDGVLGPNSVKAINAIAPARYLQDLVTLQIDFYNDLIAQKPTLAVFKKGWIKRASWAG
jgi:lysozyme family protein